jgi:hypothetical protein
LGAEPTSRGVYRFGLFEAQGDETPDFVACGQPARLNKRLSLWPGAFYKAAMIRPTFWRVFLLLGGLALAAAPTRAQLALPGATPDAAAGTPADAPKPKKKAGGAAKGDKSGASASKSAEGVESIDGRPLMLNGGVGLLQLSGRGETLQVDKLSLAGEGVSDAYQRCVVNIVGEQPIAATSDGRPDGLERYQVNVPACPFAFEVLNGAVLVPSQITACVFKAADCQTSPGGLWGPDGGSLGTHAAEIGKQRTRAENAMARALRKLEERAKDNADAANLLREQGSFAGELDDICRDYVKESEHGFCAASVIAARAALLNARLAALSPGKADKSAKSEKTARRKKPKAADAAVEKTQ